MVRREYRALLHDGSLVYAAVYRPRSTFIFNDHGSAPTGSWEVTGGVYEGTGREEARGTRRRDILTRSTPVYDLVRGAVYKATENEPLVIPEEAVVVAGSRAVTSGQGREWGISLYTPVIVKYRDAKDRYQDSIGRLLR